MTIGFVLSVIMVCLMSSSVEIIVMELWHVYDELGAKTYACRVQMILSCDLDA